MLVQTYNEIQDVIAGKIKFQMLKLLFFDKAKECYDAL